jgi:peptidoglycan/LPS O-acetylase OafA/YrhL
MLLSDRDSILDISSNMAGPVRTEAGLLPRRFGFRHFPELDGLRGFAILLVIVGHVLEFGLGVHTDLAGLGVLLFFVLSGFLITGLLDREKLRTGCVSLSAFYARRGLRLFPALAVFVTVLCLLKNAGLVKNTPWYSIAACALYVRNIWGTGSSSAHIWSLSLEEQFYVCWPWVVAGFSRRVAFRIAALGVAAVSVFRMVAIHYAWFDYNSGVFYQRSWFRFDSILLGCVIALLLCERADTGRIRARLSHAVVPLTLLPGALAWSIWGEKVTHVWYLTVQMVFAALILFHLLVSGDSAYRAAFCHPLACWFGRISYSWYLWQQFFTVADYPHSGGLPRLVLNVTASLALAVLSYRYVERPFLHLKDLLSRPDGKGRQPALEPGVSLAVDCPLK